MKKLLIIVTLFLLGCKVYLKPIFIKENKQNKTIDLVYSLQSAPFEYVINPIQELKIAKEKCVSLGYINAKPVGKQIRGCVDKYCKTKQLVNSYKCE